MSVYLTTTIERDNADVELAVTYQINRFRPATYWQPAKGGEVELIAVTHRGVEFDLTQAEQDAIEFECCQEADERAADCAEYRAEMIRDERMMANWA